MYVFQPETNNMGNRAVIAFASGEYRPSDKFAAALANFHLDLNPQWIGIYLHWNGGIESVQAFLDAAKKLGMDNANNDYLPARMCQIIGNFLGSTYSLGIGVLSSLDCDNGDNGTFVVSPDLKIVKRVHGKGYAVPKRKQEKYKSILQTTLEKNSPFFKKEQA